MELSDQEGEKGRREGDRYAGVLACFPDRQQLRAFEVLADVRPAHLVYVQRRAAKARAHKDAFVVPGVVKKKEWSSKFGRKPSYLRP